MNSVDWNDAAILAGWVIVVACLAFLAWQLSGAFVGGSLIYIGLRRS